jgi:effector-binding domain-containing protein
MLLRLALWVGLAAVMACTAAQPVWAQKPAETPPASSAKPEVPPPPQSTDPFGEDTTLVAKPIVFLKGTGTWDKAFETITASLKKLKAYVDKEGLTADGQPMAIPITAPPKNPPHGEIQIGTSPAGHALKFIHRGSYDGLDNTYEAITNYLDERRMEAKDLFIEQYVTDPLTTDEEHLVVNVLVLVK